MKLAEARQLYFAENDFCEDGGYSKPTATVYLFGLPFPIPNTESRKKAVGYHDMHHVLTGYKTNNLGEAEISAWELGSGCFEYRFAFFINMLGIYLGLFNSPSRVFRAFVRGRSTQNVYGKDTQALLEQEVDVLRRELGLDQAPKPATVSDWLLFMAVLSVSIGALLVQIAVVLWALV